MTDTVTTPAAAEDAPVVDAFVLAAAVNAVIANRGITADQAAAEIGIGAEKLPPLRRRQEVSAPVALRVLMWLNVSPRNFAAGHPVNLVTLKIPLSDFGDFAVPDDPADAAPAAQVA